MNKKFFKSVIPKLTHPFYSPLAIFILIGGLLAISQFSYHKPQDSPRSEAPASADTFIPQGFVLVPVQLHNEESLHSLLGAYGVVDLFLPAGTHRQGAKVAENVKIIRAPLNPNQFAVLVPEDQSQELVKQGGPFIAVLQNPEKAKGGVLKEPKKTSRITYGY